MNSKTIKIDTTKPMVALTFDDGPDLEITPQILALLDQYNIKASFFLIGNLLNEETTQLAKKTYQMGHEINNHTMNHPAMSKMSQEEILAETKPLTDLIIQITGEKPKFFRPPYIDVSDTLFETVDMTFICGMGCEDWVPTVSAAQRAESMLNMAKDGAIFLLHDMKGNVATVEALKVVIPKLLEQGYQFVTLTQLFHAKGVAILPEDKNMYSWVG